MGGIVAMAIIGGPAIVLLIGGIVASANAGPGTWWRLGLLAAVSTATWLGFVALYPHESPCGMGRTAACPNIYGTVAPFGEPNLAGTALLFLGFVLPAIWVGVRGRVPALASGAALLVGPLLLVWGTAPRGDNDGLWGLFFIYVALLGWMAVLVTAVTARISAAHRRRAAKGAELRTASAPDQTVAFVIDVVIVAAVLGWPLTAMSHASLEVAAFVVGIAVATVYLSVPVWMTGHTLGQALMGVTARDLETGANVSAPRAVLRGLIIVVEMTLSITLVLVVIPLIELMVLVITGKTVTDRVLQIDICAPGPIMTVSPPSASQSPVEA